MPDWARTTRVDVEARADGDPTAAQFDLMLQSLMAERFNLAVHHDARRQPVYAMVVAKEGQLGPQLKRHTDDGGCVDPLTAPNVAVAIDPNAPLPPAPCGAFRGSPAIGRLAGQRVRLEVFGRGLSGQLGRLVLDRTGLTGTWDLLMEWTPLQPVSAAGPGAGAGDTPDRPSIFTAIQEQLGLKLEPATGDVTVLVVDRVEMPTPN